MCLVCAAYALCPLGYPDQALKRTQEMLTLARELAHPYSLAYALGGAARVHQFRREGQRTHEQAEAAITLCTDQGFALCVAEGTILRGWVLAEQDQGEEGMTQIRQGLAASEPPGQRWAPVLSCRAGRGIWKSGTGRTGAERCGRSAGDREPKGGAVVRG